MLSCVMKTLCWYFNFEYPVWEFEIVVHFPLWERKTLGGWVRGCGCGLGDNELWRDFYDPIPDFGKKKSYLRVLNFS